MDSMPYLIAEVGFNHEGDMDCARRMIRAAADSGVDAVKFQTYRAIDIALPSSPHFAAIGMGEMDIAQHRMLKAETDACGVAFLSTPFSVWAVDLLEEVGVGRYKIASMDVSNPVLLRRVASTGKPVILSTGMATLAEIAGAVEVLREAGAGEIALLHCISKYPAATEDLNLAAIARLKEVFGLVTGYSDHYPGIEACFAAAVAGADIIETHFTLDNTLTTADHSHSATPAQLVELRERLTLLRAMLGNPDVNDRLDAANAAIFRRGVYAARDIAPGAVVTEEDILLCRPPTSLTPHDALRLPGLRSEAGMAQYAPFSLRKV
ncbi:MAG: N-acetylneuraminate synthase family protein [Desulfovibrionaceae bacterium]